MSEPMNLTHPGVDQVRGKSGVSEVEIEQKGFQDHHQDTGRHQEGSADGAHPVYAPATPAVPVAHPPPLSPRRGSLPLRPMRSTSPSRLRRSARSTALPVPAKPVFVNVGDTIEKGKPICIIEAMKLFNEHRERRERQHREGAGGRRQARGIRSAAVPGGSPLINLDHHRGAQTHEECVDRSGTSRP